MNPVDPKTCILPFESAGFHWKAFEAFFCDFLSKGVRLRASGQSVEVVEARPYGTEGGNQEGIDIECTMENGETWALECKHYRKTNWTAAKTRAAVKKCTYPADRVLLLISQEQVGEDARDPLPDDWELWDGRKITQAFIDAFPDRKQDAADILYRHFGRGWMEQFFDLGGRNPFLGPEAFYQPFLEDGRAFDLLAPLQGRSRELGALDTFRRSPRKRVCLLTAKGGQGKSRLLLEWVRATREAGDDVWFLDEGRPSQETLIEYLDLLKTPVTLVLDDAHRWPDQLTALAAAARARSDVKLLVTQRPALLESVKRTLLLEGYDTRQMTHMELKPLTHSQARALAEEALGHEYPGRTSALAELARQSPLTATLAGKLIREGKLKDKPLQDTDEFRTYVIAEGVEIDREALETSLPPPMVKKLLHTLALLSPLPNTPEVRKSLAAFLKQEEEDISSALDALVDAGLLHQTKSTDRWSSKERISLRIIPDVLSDYYAYQACLNNAGQSSGFSERVLEHFGATENLEQIFRNLAAVDWRAGLGKGDDGSASVFAPIWNNLDGSFQSGTNDERLEILDRIAPIAVLQPKRIIALVKWMLENRPEIVTEKEQEFPVIEMVEWMLENDPADLPPPSDKNHLVPEAEEHDWKHSWGMKKSMKLLSDIANHHPDLVADCLDLLWRFQLLGQDGTAFRGESAIALMVKVGTVEIWKSSEVVHRYLDWVERMCETPASLPDTSLAWWLPELLRPCFKVIATEAWSEEAMKSSIRAHVIPSSIMSPLRTRVFDFCETRIAWGKRWELGVLSVLGVAVKPASQQFIIGISSLPKDHANQFEADRIRALGLVGRLARDSEAPIVRCQARRIAVERLRYEPEGEIKDAARELIATIAEDFDLNLVRVLTGHRASEFAGLVSKEEGMETKEWTTLLDQRWNSFIDATAGDLCAEHPDPASGAEHLEAELPALVEDGFYPRLGPFYASLSKIDPDYATAVARLILERDMQHLGAEFGYLVTQAIRSKEKQIHWLGQGLQSEIPATRTSVIHVMAQVRQELTGQDRDKMEFLMNGVLCDEELAEEQISIILLRWFSCSPLGPFEIGLLESIPEPTRGEDALRLSHIVTYDLLAGTPDVPADSVSAILKKLRSVEDIGHSMEMDLAEISRTYPSEVFSLLEERVRAHAEGNVGGEYQPIPTGIGTFNFEALARDESIVARAREWLPSYLMSCDSGAENSYYEALLYHYIICQGTPENLAFLGQVVASIESAEVLERFVSCIRLDHHLDISHRNPPLIKIVLEKAIEFGPDCHKRFQSCLSCSTELRGYTSGEPDGDWKTSIERTRALAMRYSDDPILGPFYARIVDEDMEDIKRTKQRFLDSIDRFDEL